MKGIDTPLTRLLDIDRPVLLAGMAGGPTTPELVAAVSRAGGLGTFGLVGMQPDAVEAAVRAAKRSRERRVRAMARASEASRGRGASARERLWATI